MKQEVKVQVPFNYICRGYQEEFWRQMQSGIRRAVLVWHRRAGKEKTCWNYMIKEAMKKVGIYYYIFPDSKMARRILWDGMDGQGFKTRDHVPSPLIAGENNTEMKMTLRNGSLILVLGARDVDSLRGPNPIGCVFSEYAEHSPKAWETISPILRENGGWSIFNFTPKGQNHARDLFEMAKVNPKWYAQLLTVEDTFKPGGERVITEDDIAEERLQGMSEDMIQQEYFCSFTLGVQGSYYAKYIQEAKDESRIGNVPYDKNARVHCSWDIGYGDSTAIVFFQIVGNEIHVVDYYENHGEGLAHYAKVLRDKPYIYGDHFAPHDIESHDFSSGLSAKEVGASLGIRFITLPTLKVGFDAGIEAVRGIFNRFWVDETKCKHLIKALENYRKEFDVMREVYKERPVHDKWSHCADSVRYMAQAVRIHIDGDKQAIGDKQAEEWYNKHYPSFER